MLLLLAVVASIYIWLRSRTASVERSERQAGQSPWRILIAFVVVVVLSCSLTAASAPYERRPGEPGATPLYIGAQPVRDPGSVIIGAAGDIACPPGRWRNRSNACGMEGTAKVLKAIRPDAVLTLGDIQYPSGSLADFEASCADTWGAYRNITFPVPGNHEYETPGARGYFAYFGKRAGEPDKGYYSYDLGAWHVIALNSECDQIGGCGDSDPQARWLRRDLRAHSRKCVLAYWHKPRFSSGRHGDYRNQDALWRSLAAARAEIVLAGHDHDYERLAPMNADGDADPAGVTQFIVGTGGWRHYEFRDPKPTSKVRITGRDGVLRLQLTEQGYAWAFTAATKGEVLDRGNGQCH